MGDEDCECRTNYYPDFLSYPRKASEMALVSRDTRQMACKDALQVVVVDMREFRSDFEELSCYVLEQNPSLQEQNFLPQYWLHTVSPMV